VGKWCKKLNTILRLERFKQEYLVPNGFQIEKQVMPKPLGGWWMDFIVGKTNFPERLQFQKAD